MKIILSRCVSSSQLVAQTKKDAELAKEFLQKLFTTVEKGVDLQNHELHIEEEGKEYVIWLKKDHINLLIGLHEKVLNKHFLIDEYKDITKAIIYLKGQLSYPKLNDTPQTFKEYRQLQEEKQKENNAQTENIEKQISALLDEKGAILIEDLGLTKGTMFITLTHLKCEDRFHLSGKVGLSFRDKEEASRHAKACSTELISSLLTETYHILIEYRRLLTAFPKKNMQSETLKKLSDLVKQYDAMEIRRHQLFQILEEQTTRLTVQELSSAINHSVGKISNIFDNYRHMERMLEICKHNVIAEVEFLKELLLLSHKRGESLDSLITLKMIFSLTLTDEVIKTMVDYLLNVYFAKEDIWGNIAINLLEEIFMEKRWLAFNLFWKDSYAKKRVDDWIKLLEMLPSSAYDAFAAEITQLGFYEEFVEKALTQHIKHLYFAPREVVLKAVSKDGFALQYAHNDLKKDKEVVLKAVSSRGIAFEYAHNDLKKDKAIVLKVVSENGYVLQYADDSLKKDKEVVLKAMSQGGYVLQYADDSLKKDKAIVLKAVSKGGDVLRYVHNDLKKDKEVVLKAVSQDRYALQYADDSLTKDKAFILTAIKKNKKALDCMPNNLRGEQEYFAYAKKLVSFSEHIDDLINSVAYRYSTHHDNKNLFKNNWDSLHEKWQHANTPEENENVYECTCRLLGMMKNIIKDSQLSFFNSKTTDELIIKIEQCQELTEQLKAGVMFHQSSSESNNLRR